MRHRFHALCPYFAMFPEVFVQKHLVYSQLGDLVYDPFSGRGTTAFQSLLSHRRAIASDISDVAFCITNAKVRPPTRESLINRLTEIESEYYPAPSALAEDEFFQMCFHRQTLSQLEYLKKTLDWRHNKVDCFISALVLGRLHGESHKSPQYLSNRMPRTIATKPAYSVRWWRRHGYKPPKRNAFSILKNEVDFRFATPPPELSGSVKQGDVREASRFFRKHLGEVSLVITSPPYPDTTHFGEDQWLRSWFLGGEPHPRRPAGDDRHSSIEKYWQFLTEGWRGIRHLLRTDDVNIVIRIGGSKLDFDAAHKGLGETLSYGLERDIELVSALESKIVGGQLQSFRPHAVGTKREFDFIFHLPPY